MFKKIDVLSELDSNKVLADMLRLDKLRVQYVSSIVCWKHFFVVKYDLLEELKSQVFAGGRTHDAIDLKNRRLIRISFFISSCGEGIVSTDLMCDHDVDKAVSFPKISYNVHLLAQNEPEWNRIDGHHRRTPTTRQPNPRTTADRPSGRSSPGDFHAGFQRGRRKEHSQAFRCHAAEAVSRVKSDDLLVGGIHDQTHSSGAGNRLPGQLAGRSHQHRADAPAMGGLCHRQASQQNRRDRLSGQSLGHPRPFPGFDGDVGQREVAEHGFRWRGIRRDQDTGHAHSFLQMAAGRFPEVTVHRFQATGEFRPRMPVGQDFKSV